MTPVLLKITSVEDAYRVLSEKLDRWVVAVVSHLPNLMAAILLFIVVYFLARLLKKFTLRVSRGLKNEAIEHLLANIVFIIVLLTGLFIALGLLNLDKTVTSLLAGAGIIGLALGFAFQDIAQNFISGISLAIRRPFNIGDTIEVDGKRGVIKFLNLRTTTVINSSGEEMFIPNKELFQKTLINSSREETVRVRIVFGIPYSEDIERVHDIVVKALEKQQHILDKSSDVLFTEFTDKTVKSEARFYINRGEDYAIAKSNAIKAIKKALDENHITLNIPGD